MKIFQYLLFVALFAFSTQTFAQEKSGRSKYYSIKTANGTAHIGKLISQDEEKIILDTEKMGEVSIPKYVIEEMEEVKKDKKGNLPEIKQDNEFATRYFYTTNGFSIPQGDVHATFSGISFDVQVGVTDRITAGIQSSYYGVPIIGTIKYSIPFNEKVNFAVGALLGTGSWVLPDFSLALPFAAVTYGDRRNNVNFSVGYGATFMGGEGVADNMLISFGAALSGKTRFSLIFDSMLVPGFTNENLGTSGLIIPGFKLRSRKKARAFQFGFGVGVFDGILVPLPLPFFRYLQKF